MSDVGILLNLLKIKYNDVILKSNNKNKKYLLIIELLLISAILLTGSRKGTIILLAIYALSYLLKDCNNNTAVIINLVTAVFYIDSYLSISNNFSIFF